MEKLGIRPERLQLEWISAAEGSKWARSMNELDEMRKGVTQKEVTETIKILKSEREKAEAKKAEKSQLQIKPKQVTEIPVEAAA
jgi:heterodisulfide reductase subunit A